MFSGLGNMPELGIILSDRIVNGNSKIAVTIGSRHETSDSLCTSLVVLLDPENMYTAVGTSLLYLVYKLMKFQFLALGIFTTEGDLKKS